MRKHTKILFLLITSFIILGVLAALYFTNVLFSEGLPTYVELIYFAVLGALFTSIIYVITYAKQIKKLDYLEKRVSLWNGISYRVKGAGEGAFNNLPVGIILFKDDATVEWANKFAKDIFHNKLIDVNFKNLDDSLYTNIVKKRLSFSCNIYGKVYECSVIKDSNVLYMKDISERIEYLSRYKDRTLALGIINIDNLSNDLAGLDVKNRTEYTNQLVRLISEFEKKYNICISSISSERYLMITDHKTLVGILKDNFEILDKVREYFTTQGLHITASIGVACDDWDPNALMEKAEEQLKLAMDRGGDQTVVYMDNQVNYIGARSINLEERDAVQVRVKTQALCDLIKSSSKVLIMGHVAMDADAFGASLALLKIAKAHGKDAHIIIDEDKVDQTVSIITDSIERDHIYALEYFVTGKEALKIMDNDTLLIIADCQFEQILLEDRVYRAAKHIALIDHHRRNAGSISNYDFVYIHPSASSSVELIVEMFGYLSPDIYSKLNINEVEATWMLMGITVDTNNFAYRTTATTFNILSQLQKLGANSAMANRYLRDDVDFFTKKMAVINSMEIYKGKFAISVVPDSDIVTRQFIAKIADELVLVGGVTIAFCIGRIDKNVVNISARSLDEGNSQVIMEHLGGGGHFNNAATQIEDASCDEVKARLLDMIDTIYQGENDTMKVILTKDVKGKGKINDVLEVPAGYGNYLLRSGQAVDATPDNLKKVQDQMSAKAAEAAKEFEEAKALGEKIDQTTITIKVKTGEQGKLYGSVTSKQIVEELTNQVNLVVDKRKVMLDKDINSLGTYKIPIHLHKDVGATLTVYVVEKEQ